MSGASEKPWYFVSADFWTAAATFFLVGVGIWGVRATTNSLELSERAWLSPIGGQVTIPPEKTKGVHYYLSILNSGREPATDVHLRILNSTIEAYEPQFTDMANIKVPENTACTGLLPEKGRAVIAPNSAPNINYDTLRGEPALLADDSIIDGKKFIVLNGCLAYNTFEKARYTSFCYVVQSVPSVPTNQQNLTIVLNAAPQSGNAPGQPPISVPLATNPGTGNPARIYNFATCTSGFGAD